MSPGHSMGHMAGHQGHEAAGAHDRHAGHSVAMFRDKFWLSLALTIPVVLLSRDIQDWFGYRVPAFPGSELVRPSSARSSSPTAAWSSCKARSANSPIGSPG